MHINAVKPAQNESMFKRKQSKKWRSKRPGVWLQRCPDIIYKLNIQQWILLCLACLLSVDAIASTDIEDQRLQFEKSHKLIVSGKKYDFARLSAGLESYPLYPYLQYAHIKRNISTVTDHEISNFLSRNDQTPLAKPLRKEWLSSLAKQGSWSKFIRSYQGGLGSKLTCYSLQARIKNSGKQRARTDQMLIEDIKSMWLIGRSQLNECDPAFELLYQNNMISAELIWERIGLAMNESQLGLAETLAKRLNKQEQQKALLWRKVHKHPQKYLKHDSLLADTPLNRKIILHGVKRLIRKKVAKASILWTQLQGKYQFSAAEKSTIERKIPYQAVEQKHPEAGRWLDALQKKTSSELTQRYLIKYAIQNKEWMLLEEWTRKEPDPAFNKLRWLYWRARALEEIGKVEAARTIFKELATERDYYGFLAADRIGEKYQYNENLILLSQEERANLLTNSAIVRAKELRIVDMEKKARSEWSYATRNMNKEQLKNAAVLAHEWRWYDRTIITLGQAKAYDDVERRFPLPYSELITKYSDKHWVDRSIVYTLMRSESAFMHDARSGAGARGLMQVMPATAKETAKKIGYPYKKAKQLYEPETSIVLGTAYLKQMLNRYDNRLILAASAYNAGPHRVMAWRPENGCVAGEEWVELIPFSETRRYVRRALFYSAIYQYRLGEKVAPVTSHLTPVPALGKACS